MEPERLPFYVANPDQPGQLVGWYWVPAGQEQPVALGHNVFSAQAALLDQLKAVA
jgi:hypothetical protein